jgi:hypothetical protein
LGYYREGGTGVDPVSIDLTWIQWLVNQGVAIAVLAFLLIRLESRMTRLERLLALIATRTGVPSSEVLGNNGRATIPPAS